ncbi:hypothetical protein J2797_003079 [Paraburkholderia terricola]|uniref:hypothetical protein n=1 Tax=Paraburkholderia terricola TaxID=169427 RepID=UPI00285B4430|nr:hypothetical protein [Paraburkholderia terricola]MDR6493183.1 hypothetical protein [Paraburkholderia terricola]
MKHDASGTCRGGPQIEKNKNNDLVLQINEAGRSQIEIDFARLQLNLTISSALKRALLANVGHTAADTQKKAFASLMLLSQCLHAAGQADSPQIPFDVAYTFAKWLDASNLGYSAQVHLQTVLNLLKWCQRNAAEIIPQRATFVVHPIRSQWAAKSQPRELLSETLLKRILRACYEDIEFAERELTRGSRLRSGEVETPEERRHSELIHELLKLGKGELARQRLAHRSGHAYPRRVAAMGGQRAIGEILWLSPTKLFPFYLAILTQVSGNPDAVRNMRRSCVVPHPIRSDLECLVWEKPRSGKEQRAEFPTARQWSAPNLVRRLKQLNDELVSSAPASIKERLFICRSTSSRNIIMLSPSLVHLYFHEFIDRHGLPPFHMKDLRRAGAVLHHQAGKSIEVARRRLNHDSIRTTELYTGISDRADAHDAKINSFQGEMIRLSIGMAKSGQKVSDVNKLESVGADTVFGFRCRNPLSGIAPGSTAGQTCMQFMRCATCPGSIIPVDDPTIVARLLEALNALENARERSLSEGWSRRYELLYEPTRLILLSEIIPVIHSSVLEAARDLVQQRLVPYLD